MDNKDAAKAAFYDHKLQAHSGRYDRNCGQCVSLWESFLAWSKRAAGLDPAA